MRCPSPNTVRAIQHRRKQQHYDGHNHEFLCGVKHSRVGWAELGRALDWRLDRLQAEYLAGSPRARADLAKLRRALGKPAGSVPEAWEYTVGAVPESLRWDRDEPTRAEQAAHAALTLFAMHQQSMPVAAHVPGVSLGRAVGVLAAGGEQSADAVTRRFMAVATSPHPWTRPSSTSAALLHNYARPDWVSTTRDSPMT